MRKLPTYNFGKGSRFLSSRKVTPAGLQKIEQLIKDNKDTTFLNKNLIKDILCDIDVLKLCYLKIKSKPGNMTPGVDNLTLDGVNNELFEEIKKGINTGSYKFNPAKRIYIPKKNGSLRPLGIPSPRDKIVQEAMRIILEAIFEPTFLECSHGFRPNKSCHTAINYIRMKFGGYKWFIAGDISKCFDTIDQKILKGIIDKRIENQNIKELLNKCFKAGYIDFNKNFKETPEGTPQGSIISPILSNIYLNELDKYMVKYKTSFDKGKSARANPIYTKLIQGDLDEKTRSKEIYSKKINPKKTNDPNYKKLIYVRYADDFLIGIIGSKKDCVKVREDIANFLREELNLELNLEKTKITHAIDSRAEFIGYEIHQTPIEKRPRIKRLSKRNTIIRVNQTTRPLISAPVSKLVEKLKIEGYSKNNNEPTSQGKYIHHPTDYIVNKYASIWRGIANYYSNATNFGALNQVYYILLYSCVLTLARKLNLGTKHKVFSKYGPLLTIKNNKDEVIASFPKWEKPKLARKDWGSQTLPVDLISKISKYNIRSLEIFDQPCKICGSTEKIEMHHVRHLKDTLNKKQDYLTDMMRKMNRKQIPVCQNCHNKIHKGEYSGPKL